MTKYKVMSKVLPETITVDEEELSRYLNDENYKVLGEASTPSFGANVQSFDDEPEGNEAEELALADPKDEYQSDEGDTLNVDPDSYYAEKYLTEAERDSLREPEDKKPIDQVYQELEEDVNALREKQKAEEQRQSIERTVENREWLQGKADKPLTELTAGEFAELVDGDSPESVKEELAEWAEAEGDEEDTTPVDPMTAELAANAFNERAEKTGKSYWSDISESIRAEELGGVDSVQFDHLGDDTAVTRREVDGEVSATVETADEELMKEIRAVAKETDATIEEDTGDRILAEVSETDVREFCQ